MKEVYMSALKINLLPVDEEGIDALLSDVNLFEDIKHIEGAIKSFAGFMEKVIFSKGQLIITEGEKGDRMFILTEGSASVFCNTPDGERFKVAVLKGEDRPFFGEGGLLDQDGRTATIVADIDCHALTITRQAFDDFGKQFPGLALPILKRASRAVMKRLSKQSSDMLLLYNALITTIRGG